MEETWRPLYGFTGTFDLTAQMDAHSTGKRFICAICYTEPRHLTGSAAAEHGASTGHRIKYCSTCLSAEE